MRLHVSAELCPQPRSPAGGSRSRRRDGAAGDQAGLLGRGGAGDLRWRPVSLPGPRGGGGLGPRSRAGGAGRR